MDSETKTYSGPCYCGATTVTVNGGPMASGYCHCDDCKRFHGAPFMGWSVWMADAVEIEGEVNKSTVVDHLNRITCASCGGKVAGHLPGAGMTVVFPTILKDSGLEFKPQLHQFYDERLMDIDDALPKFVNKPEDFGGDGIQSVAPQRTGWAQTTA